MEMLSFSVILYVLFGVFFVVEGTLTPNGTISLDCGSQQTFTCSVTGAAALWTISGLSGISVTGRSGLSAANNNARINTTDTTGGTKSSTITITGFDTADNKGFIQCIDLDDDSVQGVTNISVDSDILQQTSVNVAEDTCNATLQWNQSSVPSDLNTSVSCTPPSPGCAECTTSPCNITGLKPSTNYSFTVALNSKVCNSFKANFTHMTVSSLPCDGASVEVSYVNGIDCPTVFWNGNISSVLGFDIEYEPVGNDGMSNKTCYLPANCTVEGLKSQTTYAFTITPFNSCGRPQDCQMNVINVTTNNSMCVKIKIQPDPSTTLGPPEITGITIGAIVFVLVVSTTIYALAVLIAIKFSSCKGQGYCRVFFCCYCCEGASSRSNSTEPMKSPTSDEYAGPQKVRDKKEEKLTYAALEFSEQAGSTGEKKVRSKEEPVQYAAVDQA